MKKSIQARQLISIVIIFLLPLLTFSQSSKKKYYIRDSLDQAIDISDYIVNAHGIVPVPVIITEPALGGFGAAIVPVYLKKRPAYVDTINGKVRVTPVAPDITGGLAMLTANGTWATAAF